MKLEDRRAPRDLRSAVHASEPYYATPEAVAHFRRVLAEREAEQRRRAAALKARSLLGKGRRRKRPLPAAAAAQDAPSKEKRMTVLSMSEIKQAHGRYMAGESVKDVAAEAGLSWQRLMKMFTDAGLPRRPAKGNTARGKAKPLRAEESPGYEAQKKARAPRPAAVGAQTVAAETAVSPTPPANGHETAVTRVEGVGGVARLLRELRQLDGVTVRGKIRLELEIKL